MFDIYIKNYKDNSGTLVTSETKMLSIPFENPDQVYINSPIVKQDTNASGSFDFEVEPKSSFFNSFMHMRTILRVVYDGTTIFRGRVLSINNTLRGNRKIRCEDALSFLNDTQYPGINDDKRPSQTVNAYLTSIINEHNRVCGDNDKKFTLGYVPGNYPNSITNDQKVENRTERHGKSSWDSVRGCLDELVSSYGGYVRVRYNSNGTYLDWIKDYFRVNNQTITLGKNLLDQTNSLEVNNIFTAVIPFGSSQTKNENTIVTDIKGYNTSKHSGSNYITVPDLYEYIYTTTEDRNSKLGKGYHTPEDYRDAITNYGLIFKTVSFPNAESQAVLWNYTLDWMINNYMGVVNDFSIKVIDKHQIGADGNSIPKYLVGDKVTVEYPVFKNGERESTLERKTLTIKTITYDLYNPENMQLTIGIPSDLLDHEYGSKRTDKTKKTTNKKNNDTPTASPPKSTKSPPVSRIFIHQQLRSTMNELGIFYDIGSYTVNTGNTRYNVSGSGMYWYDIARFTYNGGLYHLLASSAGITIATVSGNTATPAVLNGYSTIAPTNGEGKIFFAPDTGDGYKAYTLTTTKGMAEFLKDANVNDWIVVVVTSDDESAGAVKVSSGTIELTSGSNNNDPAGVYLSEPPKGNNHKNQYLGYLGGVDTKKPVVNEPINKETTPIYTTRPGAGVFLYGPCSDDPTDNQPLGLQAYIGPGDPKTTKSPEELANKKSTGPSLFLLDPKTTMPNVRIGPKDPLCSKEDIDEPLSGSVSLFDPNKDTDKPQAYIGPGDPSDPTDKNPDVKAVFGPTNDPQDPKKKWNVKLNVPIEWDDEGGHHKVEGSMNIEDIQLPRIKSFKTKVAAIDKAFIDQAFINEEYAGYIRANAADIDELTSKVADIEKLTVKVFLDATGKVHFASTSQTYHDSNSSDIYQSGATMMISAEDLDIRIGGYITGKRCAIENVIQGVRIVELPDDPTYTHKLQYLSAYDSDDDKYWKDAGNFSGAATLSGEWSSSGSTHTYNISATKGKINGDTNAVVVLQVKDSYLDPNLDTNFDIKLYKDSSNPQYADKNLLQTIPCYLQENVENKTVTLFSTISGANLPKAQISTTATYNAGFDAVEAPTISFTAVAANTCEIKNGTASISKKTDNTTRNTTIKINATTKDSSGNIITCNDGKIKCMELNNGATTFGRVNLNYMWDAGGSTAYISGISEASTTATSKKDLENGKKYMITPGYTSADGTAKTTGNLYIVSVPKATITFSLPAAIPNKTAGGTETRLQIPIAASGGAGSNNITLTLARAIYNPKAGTVDNCVILSNGNDIIGRINSGFDKQNDITSIGDQVTLSSDIYYKSSDRNYYTVASDANGSTLYKKGTRLKYHGDKVLYSAPVSSANFPKRKWYYVDSSGDDYLIGGSSYKVSKVTVSQAISGTKLYTVPNGTYYKAGTTVTGLYKKSSSY